MESEKVVVDELPLAIVRRVVKEKLSECSPDYDVSIHKEALLAFSESARIFIHYLSATSNDFCKDARRQTMKADDVYKALEEMDFEEFLEPLKASLEDFKKKNAGKKAGVGSTSKPVSGVASKPKETRKRKQEESSTEKGGRKSKRDEGGNKNDVIDEENENNDSTEENGNGVEENDDENTEEKISSNDEENGEEDEANSMEENGNENNDESGNEDNSMEENGSDNGEDGSEEDGSGDADGDEDGSGDVDGDEEDE